MILLAEARTADTMAFGSSEVRKTARKTRMAVGGGGDEE